jgi:tripartite ATP-independent transporter DctM subunit
MAQAMNSFPLVAAPSVHPDGKPPRRGEAHRSASCASRPRSVGSLRGGYAHASILSSMIFAGHGRIGGRRCRRHRRRRSPRDEEGRLSARDGRSDQRAAATIGPIIPPSLPMVIYGVGADVSVGRLFLAGFIPGVLMGVSLMILVAIVAPRQGLPRHAFGGLRDVWEAFKGAFWALLAPVILLGGMFSGLFTPTEAAAVADLYALFLGFIVYRTLRVADMPAILVNAAETTGIVAVLVMVAGALGWCMSLSRIPQTLAPALVASIHQPLVFLFAVEPAAARCRLLHGSARRDADPDSDPRSGRDRLRHRPGAVRARS